MAVSQNDELLSEARESLKRIQEFDPGTLVREKELGANLNFSDAVGPTRSLVELFKRLTITALDDFPDDKLTQIKNQGNSAFNLFSQILAFDTNQANPHDQRQNLINQLTQLYKPSFDHLHPLVSYSLHRSADFQRLDQEARATIQEIRDKADGLTREMQEDREAAARILIEVREVAAETGVSQQAYHFQKASEDHQTEAKAWKRLTIKLAWALGAFAFISFFIHKIPWFAPETTYDTVQLAVSKVLVFATISYMLYLAARNFLSHEHNSIINKHRQDALLTYKALVEAAGSQANRDVVLTFAASCIFSPQPTGYTGEKGEGAHGPRGVVELLTRQLTGES